MVQQLFPCLDLIDRNAALERPAKRPPCQGHSDTSKAAARQIEPCTAKGRRLIWDYLAAHPEGATDEEMQFGIDMNPSTQRPRRIELVAAGQVVDSGLKRETRSGREATVWKLKHQP